jgi:hypothetical protein
MAREAFSTNCWLRKLSALTAGCDTLTAGYDTLTAGRDALTAGRDALTASCQHYVVLPTRFTLIAASRFA